LSKEGISLSDYQQQSFVPFSAANKRTEATIQHHNESFVILKGAYLTIQELCTHPEHILDETVDA
jgi:H+-transporting ATPase